MTKKEMTKSHNRENKHRQKTVLHFTGKGEYVASYASAKEASLITGVGYSNVQSCCAGYNKMAHGKIFIYASSFGTKEELEQELAKRMVRQERKKVDRKIRQYDLTGEFLRAYNNLTEAASKTGILYGHISHCCNLTMKRAGGYIFIYEDLYESEAEIKEAVAKRCQQMEPKRKLKKVAQYDSRGNFIADFKSVTEAEKATGIQRERIQSCCKKHAKSTSNQIFLYSEEYSCEEEVQVELKRRVEGNEKDSLYRYRKGEICQFDLNGKMVETHSTIQIARQKLQIPYEQLRRCAVGYTLSTHGFIFLYKQKYHSQEEMMREVVLRLQKKQQPPKGRAKSDIGDGIVYTATHTETGIVFVGYRLKSIGFVQTEAKRIAKSHKDPLNPFEKALKHHGYESFEWDILLNDKSKKKLIEKRAEVVQQLSAKNVPLYNIPYRRDKKGVCQFTASGEKIAEYDSVHEATIETGISVNRIEEACEAKKETVEGFFFTYKKNSENQSETDEARESKEKTKVVQFTMDGKIVETHQHTVAASKTTGIKYQNIRNSCLGVRFTAKGFIFLFASELEKLSDEEFEAEIKRRQPKEKVIPSEKGIVYTAIHQKTGKLYVGNSNESLALVKNYWQLRAEGNASTAFSSDILQYGVDAFDWDILYEADTQAELRAFQKKIVEKMRKKEVQLYDIGRKANPVVQLTNKGEVIGHFKSSAQASKKLGILQINIQRCCAGIKKRIGDDVFLYLNEFETEETQREEVARRAQFVVRKTKAVAQFSTTGDYLTTYSSGSQAAKATGIPVSSIRNCCAKNVNTSHSFIFLYVDDFKTEDKMHAEAMKRAKSHEQYKNRKET